MGSGEGLLVLSNPHSSSLLHRVHSHRLAVSGVGASERDRGPLFRVKCCCKLTVCPGAAAAAVPQETRVEERGYSCGTKFYPAFLRGGLFLVPSSLSVGRVLLYVRCAYVCSGNTGLFSYVC